MDRHVAMETFVRVIDAGSFSRAARQLQVGQPAVSKAIAQLEDWLKVRLLVRSTRGLTPTEAGQSFYVRARRALEETEQAVLAARGAGARLSGKLRVAAPVCCGRPHVMPQLPRFLEKHPGLEIEMVLDDRPINLIEQGIDVAFRTGKLENSTLVARKIGEARQLVVATPGYFEMHGEPTRPEDLMAHQAVVYAPDGGGTSWTFRQGSTEISVVVGGRLTVTASEAQREVVLAHLGLAIASEWNFALELAAGSVRPVLLDWDLPTLELRAIFPTGRMASAKTREFVSFVESCIPAVNGCTIEDDRLSVTSVPARSRTDQFCNGISTILGIGLATNSQ